MIKQYSVFQRKKVNKLPLAPTLQKAREEHERKKRPFNILTDPI